MNAPEPNKPILELKDVKTFYGSIEAYLGSGALAG